MLLSQTNSMGYPLPFMTLPKESAPLTTHTTSSLQLESGETVPLQIEKGDNENELFLKIPIKVQQPDQEAQIVVPAHPQSVSHNMGESILNDNAFLILFFIFMGMITLVPQMFRRWGIPSVISLLVVGMLIGPKQLDLLGFLAEKLTFLGSDVSTIKYHTTSLINALGALGMLFLMTLAGMEADFKLLKSTKSSVISLSILTFLLPAICGFCVFYFFCPDDLPGQLLYASLFASHSVGIVFPIIRDLKVAQTKFGAAVLISTIITDVASIILLAVSVQLKRMTCDTAVLSSKTLSLFDWIDPQVFGDWFTPLFLLLVVIFMVTVLWVVPLIGRYFLKITERGDDVLITFFLMTILTTALIGEFFGINLIVGAFIAGLSLSRVAKLNLKNGSVFHKFEGIGYGFLIPFLFISIGMKTDLSILFKSWNNLTIVLITVIGLVGSKVFSGWLALKLTGDSNAKGLCAGLMTVPQLSATLAAASIGKELGMLNDNFFNAIIILSIVTTLPIPSLVKWVISAFNIKFEDQLADAPIVLAAEGEKEEYEDF